MSVTSEELSAELISREEVGAAGNVDFRPSTVIQPRSAWELLSWCELVVYRDLFRIPVW